LEFEINISRLNYLLKLYDISIDNLLVWISEGLKKPISKEDILRADIKLNHLKRIDKIFNKGLHFYIDPKNLEESKEQSIFFRKEKFNAELNLGAKKIVNQFEELKISLSALSKLAELPNKRKLPIYGLGDDPQLVANKVRKKLYPNFNRNKKEFLKALIGKFSVFNILVFEFVETWNKKEKANIDGFFLIPNVIVIKRQQQSFRREIFTLIHELGHFLINEEEIEKLEYQDIYSATISKEERWCNDFAYYFLIGDYNNTLLGIDNASSSNDYCHSLVAKISENTHLSKLSLYTRLLLLGKISVKNYNKVRDDFEADFLLHQEEEKKKKELEKSLGIKQRGTSPQPIKAPLFVETIQAAYHQGIINELEVCKHLKIKPEKLHKYIE